MKNYIGLILVCTIFVGALLCNRSVFVWGLPMFFVWNIGSVLLITVVMWIIYKVDPDNRNP